MAGQNGKVTTREFYEKLLEIEPRLQKMDDKLCSLLEWAKGDNGVDRRLEETDRRLDDIESRHIAEDSRNKVWVGIALFLKGLAIAVVGFAGALIGKGM